MSQFEIGLRLIAGFVPSWVRENVNPEAYAPEGDMESARELAERCRSDAEANGISDQDLDAAVDDLLGGGSGLVAYIADAMRAEAGRDFKLRHYR